MTRYRSILLVPLFLCGFNTVAFAGRINRFSNDCHQVGVILKSDDPNVTGYLCKGDRLVVESKILISCKYQPFLEWVGAGEYDVNRFCPSSLSTQQECRGGRSCFRTGTRLYLMGQTYASTDLRPHLRWSTVDESAEYSLLIQSSDGTEVYRFRTTDSEYKFTEDLTPGVLYQIDISIMGKAGSEKFAFHILSPDHVNELNSMLEIINSGEWTEIEKALYRDGAYTRFGLTLEAIESLEQTPTLKTSRELQTRLGERYMDAGYLDKAREVFERLEQTTSGEDGNLQSQLPTSTKFPHL